MQVHVPFTIRLPTLVFIAWRNIWRNPIRSLLTISALAGGMMMVILYASIMEGMVRQMVQYATEITTSHIQVHRQAFIDDQDLYATLPWNYLSRIEQEIPEIKAAPRLYAAGLASSGDYSSGALIKAVDPQRERQVTVMLDHLRSGEVDLAPVAGNDATGRRYNVMVGAQMAKNLKLQVGSELVVITQAADGSVGNALYRVAAVLRPIEPNFDRMGVLMSIDAFRELMYLESGFHELAIKTPDSQQMEVIEEHLHRVIDQLLVEQPLDELGGPPIIRNWRELTPAVADMLELSKYMVYLIGSIVVGLASLGMLNTMLMAVHERTHEFGILLSLGMKRRWLLAMVLLESLFLALVSAVVGAILGAVGSHWLELHGIDYSGSMPDGFDWGGIIFEPVMKGYMEPSHIVNSAILMIVITMLASLVPSWRTVRLKPAEVLR